MKLLVSRYQERLIPVQPCWYNCLSLSVDPSWRSGVLPRYAPYLLRQRPDAACDHRYRSGWWRAAHSDHRRADRLQEEDS